jgi:tetratricopeptide (TPR) repeat protein
MSAATTKRTTSAARLPGASRATLLTLALPTVFRAALLTLLCASTTTRAEEPDATSTRQEAPLVALSLEIGLPERDYTFKRMRHLRAVRYDIEHNPPPAGAECAKTLGADRFAGQYQRLAIVQLELGDFEDAIASSHSALQCRPRWAPLYGDIASAQLSLGNVTEARTALTQGLEIDPENRPLLEARARLDFVEERWANAMAQLRNSTVESERTSFAPYAECLFWLTQRRAGTREPEVLPHEAEDTRWPFPILETLLERKTETQLADDIRELRVDKTRREWLTEALYYIGQRYLADGEPETARRHFAAVVNLKQMDFVEYGMARAQLARLSDQY